MTDASNRRSDKMLPFIVRTYSTTSGVRHFHLSLVLIEEETAVSMLNEMLKVLNDFEIKDKVVGFCADNAAVNFGSVTRGGENNIFYLLKQELDREIFGIGCSAHVAHNAAQAGFMVLDFDFEALAVNFHKYFKIYTRRVANLKTLCDKYEIQYVSLEHHGSTRFLTLLPALEKIKKMYKPLEEMMRGNVTSQNIQNFFESPAAKFMLHFAISQLENFNSAVLFFEKSSTASFESYREYNILKTKITTRMEHVFLPTECKNELKNLSQTEQMRVMRVVNKFYKKTKRYLDDWTESFDESNIFSWMSLLAVPSYEEVQLSNETASRKYGKLVAEENELFDNFAALKIYLESQVSELRDLSAEEKWKKIFDHFSSISMSITAMQKLVEFAFVLPGTSAEAERVFSRINKIWDNKRNNLHLETLNSLIATQYNSKMSCTEFFESIKLNTEFLKSVHSSQKYQK